jgi:molybdenum cofactor cytidylyltransferase
LINQENKNITIIILAAGSSSRLGRPKQLLELDGNTLLQKSITAALNVSKNVIVVLGANDKLIHPTISIFPIEKVFNENWATGMSSSIRTGMKSIDGSTTNAVLIMLCDQPYVDTALLKKMVSAFEKSERSIIASEYEGKVGVPAIFDVSFFQKLKTLEGQKGAKALIINNLEKVERVIFEKGKIDIDTEEAWKEFKKQRNK